MKYILTAGKYPSRLSTRLNRTFWLFLLILAFYVAAFIPTSHAQHYSIGNMYLFPWAGMTVLNVEVRNVGSDYIFLRDDMVNCHYQCPDNLGSGGTRVIQGAYGLEAGQSSRIILQLAINPPCGPATALFMQCRVGTLSISDWINIPY